MFVPSYTGNGFGISQAVSEITVDHEKGLKATSAHINNRGNFYEIIYFIEGETNYFIEGDFYPLNPGDIVFSNSSEIHGIVHRNPCVYRRMVIKVLPDFFLINNLENIKKSFDNKYPGEGNYISHRTPLGKILNEKIEVLNEYLSTSGMSSRLICDVLTDILKLLGSQIVCLDSSGHNPLLRKIVEYINENAHDDIGLNSIAERFYIDRTHLARIFKHLTKCSVNEYITQIRFEHINQLRRYSKMSMAEAVKFVGFKNYSTFYRAYKKSFGVAPGKNDPIPYAEYIDFNANH